MKNLIKIYKKTVKQMTSNIRENKQLRNQLIKVEERLAKNTEQFGELLSHYYKFKKQLLTEENNVTNSDLIEWTDSYISSRVSNFKLWEAKND